MSLCKESAFLCSLGQGLYQICNSKYYFCFFRESRRKTPVAVSFRNGERFFGDGALGVVRFSVIVINQNYGHC